VQIETVFHGLAKQASRPSPVPATIFVVAARDRACLSSHELAGLSCFFEQIRPGERGRGDVVTHVSQKVAGLIRAAAGWIADGLTNDPERGHGRKAARMS